MSTILETITNRYSCRAYTAERVSAEDLEYIKECVRLAPSAVNRQPWRFRLIESAEEKEKIRKCYDREWFATAPLYILASVRHDEEWTRADGKRHGDIDVAIAVEHLCLAAAELNLGTCWVCNFDADMCRKLFNMPAEEEPTVVIPLGHPACEPSPKKRRPMTDIWQ